MSNSHRGKLIRVCLGLFAGLVVCSSIPTLAFAADTSNQAQTEAILLSPTSKQYKLDAGTQKRDSFKIINDGQTAFNFVVYARPYSVHDESYTPDFISSAQNADAYKWVQFDRSSYFVEPGKSITVDYTIRVPSGAAPGGHYGVLFAETQPAETAQGTAIIRKKRVGAILYVTVNGRVTLDGQFAGWSIPPFQFKGPLTIRERITNSGNTDFQVRSNVRISDVFGGLKFKTDKEVAVLPGTTREIVNDWQNPAWLGVYKVDSMVSFVDAKHSSTHYVLFVPIWVYITLGLLIGARLLYEVATRRNQKK